VNIGLFFKVQKTQMSGVCARKFKLSSKEEETEEGRVSGLCARGKCGSNDVLVVEIRPRHVKSDSIFSPRNKLAKFFEKNTAFLEIFSETTFFLIWKYVQHGNLSRQIAVEAC
jgi:hypothetical protein